jgi:hypothetical protein
MPSRPKGARRLTLAERSALFRQRRKEREREMSALPARILAAKTLAEAHRIVAEVTQGRPE